MAQEEKVESPECGYDVGTKENGTRIKAHKVDGEKCGGSDELVQRDEPTTDGIDKGGSSEAQDSPQGSRDETDDKNDPETPKEPETGTQRAEERGGGKEFGSTCRSRWSPEQ